MPPETTPPPDAKRVARDAFIVFEHKEGSKLVDCREIATIIRATGINPSNTQLQEVKQQLKAGSDDDLNLVPLETFEKVMAAFTAEQKDALLRDDYHRVLRALRSLDPEGRGYFEADEFKTLLMTRGEAFSAQEASNMLSCATDPATGRIYIEDYAQILAGDGRAV